ncbi:MAG: hypothetical protein IKX59_05815 [Bacteroidales bacterium]|nr:hypothetical protein [Bacteroidales bacterium]
MNPSEPIPPLKPAHLLLQLLLAAASFPLQAQEAIVDTTRLTYTLFFPTPYYRVNYTYESVAPDGTTPVTLSSALFFPQRIFERTKLVAIGSEDFNASGLVLNNHYTITTRDQAPTVTSSPQIEGPFVTLGPDVITISPDGYGFGITADKPQTYLMADATARNNIDAVKAARRLLKQMGYTCGNLFAQFGYSQGGHSTLAVQRYFDTHDPDPEAITHIDYTLCGAGPYDLSAMMDSLLIPGAMYSYPCALALIAAGQIEGASLDISFSDIFPQPLDTKVIDWIDGKELTADAINDSIFAITGGDGKTGTLVSNILRTDNLSRTNPQMVPFFQAVDDNSLVSEWQPNDKTRFFIYHSRNDEIVPYYNMEHLRDFLRDDCGLDSDRLEVESTKGFHTEAATNFVLNVINKIAYLQTDYLAAAEDLPIIDLSNDPSNASSHNHNSIPSGWFTLHGHRLPAAPTSPGLYLHNGRKVLIR